MAAMSTCTTLYITEREVKMDGRRGPQMASLGLGALSPVTRVTWQHVSQAMLTFQTLGSYINTHKESWNVTQD